MHAEDRAVFGSGMAACPQGDADIESFNGSLREECLNVHWFEDVTDVRAKMQAWQKEYNEDRPHRSLKNVTPLHSTRRSGTHRGQKIADPVDQKSGTLHPGHFLTFDVGLNWGEGQLFDHFSVSPTCV